MPPRTALALIGFGFGIKHIVAAIHQTLGDTVNPLRLSQVLGLSFITLGTLALMGAALDHKHQLQRIQHNDLVYRSRQSPALVVAYVLTGLRAIAFVGILISPLLN